ncbi:MAG: T9SS type A sorting domain-containing protein [Elusimicrobia bacterium]|nr:T9SS type A sorting domain-containing protein [Elusimicrobiota bacterium]
MPRTTLAWSFLALSCFLPHSALAYVSNGGDWDLIKSVHGELGATLTGSDYKVTQSMGEPFIALSPLVNGDTSTLAGYLSQVPSVSTAGTSTTGADGSSNTLTVDSVVYGFKPADSVRVYFNNEMTSTTLPGSVQVRAVFDSMGNTISAPQAYTLTYSATEQAAYVSLGAGWPKGTLFELTVSTDAEEINGQALAAVSTVTFSTARDATVENIAVRPQEPRTLVQVPAGAFEADYTLILSTGVQHDSIRAANETQAANMGAVATPFKTARIDAYGPSLEPRTGTLLAEASIILPFDDANADGKVDGTSPIVRSKTVSMWRLDEDAQLWVRQPRALLDLGLNRVVLPTNHFSIYSLAGGSDTDVSLSYAFPVPFRPGAGNAARYGTWAEGIRFTNLPSSGRIRIFTVSGELVRDMEVTDTPQRWDLKNQTGEVVASGVYIWEVTSGENRKTGKLMVIK